MYAGELVEEGTIRQVFGNPRHPYTRGLLDSLPTLGRDKQSAPLIPIPGHVTSLAARPPGCAFAERCAHVDAPRCRRAPIPVVPLADEPGHRVQCVRNPELAPWRRSAGAGAAAAGAAPPEPAVTVAGLRKRYPQGRGPFGPRDQWVHALNGASLEAPRGRTLAIVGESGCGKSTLARILAGLETASEGRVALGDREVGRIPVDARPAALTRALQMVFQNPDSTLNPSHTVGFAIARAVRRLRALPARQAPREVERLLQVVQLGPEFAARRPHQLSGGQRQRVAIARALAGDPEVLVADEPVSSLDVSVQAAIVNLLGELQADRAVTLVFISHDLAVVRYLADHVAVMYLGSVVEFGPVARVFAPPHHPYTEALLSAVPVPDPDAPEARILLEGPLPSATALPRGCPFASRCPRRLGSVCEETPPPEQRLGDGHRIACHIPADELTALHRAGPPARSGVPEGAGRPS
jgi:peptide/nickel transport system ATP-binding protein